MCRTSAERTSTRPSSKQRLAPRLPVWCSKVALNGSTRRKAGTRLGPVPILFVLLVELPVSGRYWPCTIVRVFFFAPFHTKRATFSVCGAHCGACSARILRKFSLNVHALCVRRCWGGFGGVGLRCYRSFLVHVRFAAAFHVVKGGECFGTSRCPGGVRDV